MAVVNKDRKNHVFAVWLKADAAVIEDKATTAQTPIILPVDTSLVIFDLDGNGNNLCTLPDGEVPGQIIVLRAEAASGTNKATITVTSVTNDDYDTITVDAIGETATLLWNGEAWTLIASRTASIA